MHSVLFVCTANVCRSPMAEVLFIDQVKRMEQDPAQWRVESAGTWAQDGNPASRNSAEVMKERGLDLSQHSSRIVTTNLMAQFNLILVMEANHKEALHYEFPALAERIFMLSEMTGKKVSVDDPIGLDMIAYRKCADEIQKWIERGWENILRLA
jgi:protein-tyrosine-phosphatase